jgi:hypothetical protein
VRPLAVLNAILFGSAAAITFGLVGVLVIFLLLSGRHPEMQAELPALWRSALLFTALTAASGASLFGVLRGLKWRWAALFATLLLVAGMAAFYVRP